MAPVFSERGYNCVAPAWPLHEGDPRTLRAHPPAGLGELGLNDVLATVQEVVSRFDRPIMIGHSVGA